MSDHISTIGDSSRSVTSICGPYEYINPIGVRVPHNPRAGFKELNLWPTTMVVNLLSLINLIKAAGSSALVFKVRDDFGTFNLPPRVI